jgi:glycosyltransferase involved in cell wall biosynthesis
MNPLLSIVIPIYDVEKYIEACLDSIFKQLPDWAEVVLVDDGSPDNSMAIVREKFDRWISNGQLYLFEQNNKGPGGARNTGIKHSRGEFIGFIDSDDIILEHYFDAIADCLKSGEADIVEFGFKRFKTGAGISGEVYRPLYKFDGLKKLNQVREDVFSVGCWYPSTRIFRNKVIRLHFFPENKHYEDLMTIPFIYLQDLVVFFIDKPLLGYRKNRNSISSKHTAKQMNDLYEFYTSIPMENDCDAMAFLKIKVARSMIFFYSELRVSSFPIDEVICEVRRMRLSPLASKKLPLPDLLFFHFPASYVLIDKIRVPVKKILSQLK